MQCIWIPRPKLDRADFIGHIIDVDDWQITTSFFEFLDYIWRPHTVDCFANFYLTNRFHVAVHLSSNRSQMTSKCGKNKKVAHEAIAECVTDVLTTF